MERSEIKEIVRKSEIFSTMDEDELDLLLYYGDEKRFPSGHPVYRTGEAAEGTFCLILRGTVEIVTETDESIRKMGVGEVIGEIGATSPQSKRTVTARTTEPTFLLEWHVGYIKDHWPGIMKKLKDQAWKRLTNYYELVR
jgi:signal-transduction protein with cAMP-binding, CBS, and nucleotidyltransferase domain